MIRNFLTGYQQGAAHVAPDLRVDAVFAGTFDDPAKGSELTLALYGQGADIVYNFAGPTGEGLMQASAAADTYSIGVDIDMSGSAAGNVLASMLKRGDVAVYELIKQEVRGPRVEPGTDTFDLASGGVDAKLCSEVAFPDSIPARLPEIKADILAAKIKVESVK